MVRSSCVELRGINASKLECRRFMAYWSDLGQSKCLDIVGINPDTRVQDLTDEEVTKIAVIQNDWQGGR